MIEQDWLWGEITSKLRKFINRTHLLRWITSYPRSELGTSNNVFSSQVHIASRATAAALIEHVVFDIITGQLRAYHRVWPEDLIEFYYAGS
jgi:hypothetical protein